jgi:hypothetical protein
MADKAIIKTIGEVVMGIIKEVLLFTIATGISVATNKGGTILVEVRMNSASGLVGMRCLHVLVLMQIFFGKLCKL